MTIHDFFSLLREEKQNLEKKLAVRQDGPQGSSLQVPLTVLGTLLGLGVSRLLSLSSTPPQLLQDHPQCGITTGGQVSNTQGVKSFTFSSGKSNCLIWSGQECLH